MLYVDHSLPNVGKKKSSTLGPLLGLQVYNLTCYNSVSAIKLVGMFQYVFSCLGSVILTVFAVL